MELHILVICCIFQCMYAFTYWHAYYDAAYLQYPLKISPLFYRELQIQTAVTQKWIELPMLPQLPKLFQLIENFINNKTVWITCNCNIIEAIVIESNLNQIMLRIYCEKLYAKEYWPQDKRRVQASFVHFLMLLKHIVVALIPQDCDSLLQAMHQQKLCVQIHSLETLVNQVLQNLRPIFNFMLQKLFREERQLTSLFFEQISTFLGRLPEIKRQELIQIPKIMHYICLRNPIESTKEHTNQLEQQIRKKSTTLNQNSQLMKPLRSIQEDDDRNSDILDTRQFIKHRANHRSTDRSSAAFSINKDQNKTTNITFFRFNKSICKEETLPDKKLTMDTIQSKDKSLSIGQPPRYRANTVSPHSKSPIKSKSFMQTRNKLVSLSNNQRDRLATSKSKDSQKTVDIRRKKTEVKEQEQMERPDMPHRHTPFLTPTKLILYSSQINLTGGYSKGWGLVREYVFHKIAQRKLSRLICTF